MPRTCVLLTIGALALTPAVAAEVQIIANESIQVNSVSSEELKSLFLLNKTTLSDGSRVEPVLEKGGPVHENFVKGIVGKTDAALQTYYRSLVFTGKASMPKTLGGDTEVIAYVAKTKGALGYVSARAKPAGVKTLEVK